MPIRLTIRPLWVTELPIRLQKPRDSVKAYEVGYCKPPVNTRFKKGQSGNPGGKPGPKCAKEKLFAQLLEAGLDQHPPAPANTTPSSIFDFAAKTILLGVTRGEPDAIELIFQIIDECRPRPKRRHRRSHLEPAIARRGESDTTPLSQGKSRAIANLRCGIRRASPCAHR